MTSLDLLAQWTRERDAEAFKQLTERYAPMVHATSIRILKDVSEAEDVTQECFELLAQTSKGPKEHLGAWLHAVAANRSLKRLRKEQRRKGREARYVAGRPSHAEIRWDDVYEYVDESIAELPVSLRVPVVAHFLQGETHGAVAKSLGVSRQTVTYRIGKGVERIRKSLKRKGIPVSSAALASLMGANLAEAAPISATLTAVLGKMALAGPSAVTVGAGSLGSISTLKAGLLAGVVAVVATVGTIAHFANENSEQLELPNLASPAIQQETVASAGAQEPPAGAAAPQTGPGGPGSIGVTVLSGDTPVEGATVMATLVDWPDYTIPPKNPFKKTARADGEGTYLVEDLPLARYLVEAYLGDLYANRPAYASEDGAHKTTLTLKPAGSLGGYVHNGEGEPVPNAVLYRLDEDEQADTWPAAVTDEAGAFSAYHVPEGEWRFLVKAEGYANKAPPNAIATGTYDTEIILRPGHTLSGRVTVASTGERVPNVRVRASRQFWNTNETTTDADGVFQFSHIGAGPWWLMPGERSTEDFEVHNVGPYFWKGPAPRIEVVKGEDAGPVELQLIEPGVITGRVFDAETGEGLPGVALKSYNFHRNPGTFTTGFSDMGPSRVDTVTDQNGRYRIERLQEGKYWPQAKAPPGYADKPDYKGKAIKIAAGSVVTGVDIPFIRGIPITGIVLGKDGEPVSEGKVFLDEGGYENAWTSIAEDGAFAFYLSEPTDAFKLYAVSTPMESDLRWLSMSRAKAISETIGPMTLGAEGVKDLVLRLTEPARISGRIVDEAGAPVEGASWAFKVAHRGAWYSLERTKADGKFELKSLPAGEHELKVGRPAAYEDSDAKIVVQFPAVRIGQQLTGMVVKTGWRKKMAFQRLTISGRVVDPAGKRVPAMVVATPSDARPGHRASARAQTLGNGAFELTNLEQGYYTVGAGSAYGYSPVEMRNVAAGSTGIELVMPRCVAIEGVVLSAETGEPIPEFEMKALTDAPPGLVDYSSTQFRGFNDKKGYFKLGNVPIGDTALAVRAKGYSVAVHEVGQVRADQTLSGVVVRLVRGGVVEGIVTNYNGELIEGVEVYDGEKQIYIPRSFAALTGADGRFRIAGLPDGPHMLHAVHGEYAPARVSVQVAADRSSHADIQLPAGGTLEGRVMQEGQLAAGSHVEVKRLSSSERLGHSGRTGLDARYRIARLPAGEALAEATRYGIRGNMMLERIVVLEDGQVTTVDFDFPPFPDFAATLEGVVTYHGQPVASAHAWLEVDLPSGATAGPSGQNLEAGGAYEFTALPEGVGRLRITYASPKGRMKKELAIELKIGEAIRRDIEMAEGGATIAGYVLAQPRRGSLHIAAFEGVVDTTMLDAATVFPIFEGERFFTDVYEDGSFMFEAHPPGTYTVIPHLFGSLTHKGRFVGPPVVVSVAEGEEVFVELTGGP